MVEPIRHQLMIDCAEPIALAAFWAEAMGYVAEDNSALIRAVMESGHAEAEQVVDLGDRLAWLEFAAIRHPEDPFDEFRGSGLGRRVLFQKVPEPKTGKNRVHLDLVVGAERHRQEVERIVALGAAVLREVDEPMGRWTVMADPEGNEFCIA
jgi:hypothetical protein